MIWSSSTHLSFDFSYSSRVPDVPPLAAEDGRLAIAVGGGVPGAAGEELEQGVAGGQEALRGRGVREEVVRVVEVLERN